MIDNVYQKLRDQNICSSAYDFSVRFLGKSRSYYSVIKSRNEEPSIEVMSTLEIALRHASRQYSDKHPVLTATRLTLESLSEEVRDLREKKSNELLSLIE